jgi:hypothetical protein
LLSLNLLQKVLICFEVTGDTLRQLRSANAAKTYEILVSANRFQDGRWALPT